MDVAIVTYCRSRSTDYPQCTYQKKHPVLWFNDENNANTVWIIHNVCVIGDAESQSSFVQH